MICAGISPAERFRRLGLFFAMYYVGVKCGRIYFMGFSLFVDLSFRWWANMVCPPYGLFAAVVERHVRQSCADFFADAVIGVVADVLDAHEFVPHAQSAFVDAVAEARFDCIRCAAVIYGFGRVPTILKSGCLYALATPPFSVCCSNFSGSLPIVSPKILRQAKYVASESRDLSTAPMFKKSSKPCVVVVSVNVFLLQNAN